MPSFSQVRRGRLLVILIAGLVAVALVTFVVVVVRQRASVDANRLVIEVLSSRADDVTGGDARISVTAPDGVQVNRVRVSVDGVDATSSLRPTGDRVEGAVTGLDSKANTVTATAPGAGGASITLTNHPITGPLLSGPHEAPFFCQTQSFKLVTGQNLGAPLDGDCSIAPRVDYVYRSKTTGAFLTLPAAARTQPSQRPTDIATVKNSDGGSSQFIVRVETRTIDRGISQVAMLDDPADPTRPGWNHKMIYTFGGDCAAGWYAQGSKTAGVMSPRLLSQGYAVASNSLNEQNCNDLLAAEAFAMTREQFIQDHGVPTYTMGIGCGGGSQQAQGIADNYPGLLNGIVVGCSSPDVASDPSTRLFDARLLANYARRFPDRLTPDQLRQVAGFATVASLAAASKAANELNPRGEFSAAVPVKDRFDPRTNPRGARSTTWDHTINVYGRFTKTGYARRPIDNVGVQYGLEALKEGAITVDEFLDLNQGIGGLDPQLSPSDTRTVAIGPAVANAYSTGRVLNGGGGLDTIPIIDFRAYTDKLDPADQHLRYETFVTQARLVAANGDADNEVLLTVDGKAGFDLDRGVLASSVDSMDRWLLDIVKTGRTSHATVVAAKPSQLVDACWTPAGQKIAEKQTYRGPGKCNQLYPSSASPRLVAGEPLTSDVLICSLVPADSTSYGRPFTVPQTNRLRSVFPDGVCDWTQPGRYQGRPSGPWLSLPSS